jgi:hypothetical protein
MAAPPSTTPKTTDPNDPSKFRSMVSYEEREAIGLTPRTWTGVVHPEVYPTLTRLNKNIVELRERLRKDKDVRAFDALSQIEFPSMVYVQIQLTELDAQRRVLQSLTAAEFHRPYLFETLAGLTGYVSQSGLDKLAHHPDVLGLCLDDNPLPITRKLIDKDSIPSAKQGEANDEPGVKEGIVDADVYRAFALSDRVTVDVSLRTTSLPGWDDLPADTQARNELRDIAYAELQDRLLSSLSADDFRLKSKCMSSLSGSVTRESLQILWKHPDVQKVTIPRLARITDPRN